MLRFEISPADPTVRSIMTACPIPDGGTSSHTEIMEDRSQAAGRSAGARPDGVRIFSRADPVLFAGFGEYSVFDRFLRDGPLERAQLLERLGASHDIDGAGDLWPVSWTPRHV
jgi:hypothetical protein